MGEFILKEVNSKCYKQICLGNVAHQITKAVTLFSQLPTHPQTPFHIYSLQVVTVLLPELIC